MTQQLTELKSSSQLQECVTKANGGLVVLHFWAPWAPQCQQLTDVLCELTKDPAHSGSQFLQVEAEALPEISMKYEIAAVPTCVLIKNNKVVEKVNGANIPELTEKAARYASQTAAPSAKPAGSGQDDLDKRLQTLLNSAPVILFMKGNRDQARCGFSKQIIEILNKEGVQYTTFDILQDEDVRQGLKKFSDWPTYPQLYANGELLGGLDIVKEMVASGDFKAQLPVVKSLDERLKELVNKERVVLFMKGSPDTPRCGFSKTTVAILDEIGEPYGHFDILSDEEVRQGLKTFSNWPTYPQLYVNGELLGGLDIIKEMKESGDLEAALAEGK